MIEIAERSGVKRRAIYQKHFKNSKEIVAYLRQLTNTQIFDLFQKYAPLPERILLIILRIVYFPYIKKQKFIRYFYTTAIDPGWRSYIRNTYKRVSGTTFRIRL